MKTKMKRAITIILGVITVTAGFAATAGVPQAAYAQSAEISEKAIANRNEAKVSVDNKTVTIVTYVIDGYNYFRVADLCQALNMKVFYYPTDLGNGVKIVSNKEFDGSVEAPPDENRLNVIVNDINVFYDVGHLKAKCFNIGGRNYIKLADIVAAANNNYEIKLQSVQEQAQSGTGQAITTRPTTVDLKTSFDSSTKTITITKTKTDFQKLYEELYTMQQGKAPNEQSKEDKQPKTIAQPELTQAPQIGIIPAKILKDATKPAYIDGKVNLENYSIPYAKSLVGQCTWYARGRFEEVTGVAYPYGESIYDIDTVSKNDLLKVIKNPDLIEARSIAVFGDVHVLFIEYIERDAQGSPTYIYFTESNTGHDGIYRPNQDGKVQKLDFKSFINRQSTYKGCITIK